MLLGCPRGFLCSRVLFLSLLLPPAETVRGTVCCHRLRAAGRRCAPPSSVFTLCTAATGDDLRACLGVCVRLCGGLLPVVTRSALKQTWSYGLL